MAALIHIRVGAMLLEGGGIGTAVMEFKSFVSK